jgi:aryl-alcohol dehydrogenase-like predicted oxidoreductase
MGGLLTDRRADRSQLPADDRYHDANWDDAYQQLEMLKTTLGADITSWTEFAIKFGLCHPIVTSLIVGMNSIEQVDGVLDAADGNYPDRSVFDKALEIYRAGKVQ